MQITRHKCLIYKLHFHSLFLNSSPISNIHSVGERIWMALCHRASHRSQCQHLKPCDSMNKAWCSEQRNGQGMTIKQASSVLWGLQTSQSPYSLGGTTAERQLSSVCHCAWRDAAVLLGPSSHPQALKQWDTVESCGVSIHSMPLSWIVALCLVS